MSAIASFIFNPFQENTYIVYDDTKECIIIDPGCYEKREEDELTDFIKEKELKPVRLINTHCHIDHVFGNRFIHEKYNLPLEIHQKDAPVLGASPLVADQYGLKYNPSPAAEKFLEEGDEVKFGNTTLKVLFTPGHAPGHVTLYNEADKYVLSGDVLFLQSIGRTDLPGGDYDTLIASIKQKLLPLGDEVKVYSGHGPTTTIGYEKRNNPFLS